MQRLIDTSHSDWSNDPGRLALVATIRARFPEVDEETIKIVIAPDGDGPTVCGENHVRSLAFHIEGVQLSINWPEPEPVCAINGVTARTIDQIERLWTGLQAVLAAVEVGE